MENTFYFILLICGVLSQGICRLPEENNEESSDLQIRQKRVAGGDRLHRHEVPFLLSILVSGNHHCPASLLTTDSAITSADCFMNQDVSTMTVESRSQVGTIPHHIVGLIFLDPHYNATRPTFKNLALVKFGPPINFQASYNRPIRIHSGSIVEQRLQFQVLNWGRPFPRGGRVAPEHYRSIPVQVISIQYCQEFYPGIIGPGNICTSPLNYGQHGTDKDTGAALLVDNHLLGIMAYRGLGRASIPDVFMNLLDHDIRRWIHQHVPSLRLF